ncbi:MAG TPA: bifunctional methionine sulfoxide reductase B/A protein [Prolixibacteraceae bacterium]|nr:bifunctional methionine sulfoxide reductase B/A protein [Prolixibacteraceae bacterium]
MKTFLLSIVILLSGLTGCSQNVTNKKMDNRIQNIKFNPLTPEEAAVILDKGTELPFTGKYTDFSEKGTYVCKQCNAPLYRSSDKFKSDCGWPSFDDEIPGAVKRIPDGMRTEIVCANCGAHLGHVFAGEGFTAKNTRHCVNSISLIFVPAALHKAASDTAIFAGGCFWGVEYYMHKAPGVISTEVGYIGGHGSKPTYEEVCSHKTGYAEAVRIVFDPKKTNYENVTKLFFEIHDPTQVDRQGPDIGDQYRSAVFFLNMDQKKIADNLIEQLKVKGLKVATRVVPATKFWKAEEYHQQYYIKENGTPYCHRYVKRF